MTDHKQAFNEWFDQWYRGQQTTDIHRIDAEEAFIAGRKFQRDRFVSDLDAATTAERAFNAYRYVMAQRGGEHYAARMPVWADLSPVIQQVWIEASRPLIAQIAEARAALLDRIADLASQMHASFAADHPEGARASFADWLRTYARADLLDGGTPARDFIRLSDREKARSLLDEARELIGKARHVWETPADGHWMGRAMTWLDRYDGKIPGHRPRLLDEPR